MSILFYFEYDFKKDDFYISQIFASDKVKQNLSKWVRTQVDTSFWTHYRITSFKSSWLCLSGQLKHVFSFLMTGSIIGQKVL